QLPGPTEEQRAGEPPASEEGTRAESVEERQPDSNASAPQNFSPRFNPTQNYSRRSGNDRQGQNYGRGGDRGRGRFGRRGGRHRGDRQQGGPGGRNLPPSKYASPQSGEFRGYDNRGGQQPGYDNRRQEGPRSSGASPADLGEETIVLPGESLAKYRDKAAASPAAAPIADQRSRTEPSGAAAGHEPLSAAAEQSSKKKTATREPRPLRNRNPGTPPGSARRRVPNGRRAAPPTARNSPRMSRKRPPNMPPPWASTRKWKKNRKSSKGNWVAPNRKRKTFRPQSNLWKNLLKADKFAPKPKSSPPQAASPLPKQPFPKRPNSCYPAKRAVPEQLRRAIPRASAATRARASNGPSGAIAAAVPIGAAATAAVNDSNAGAPAAVTTAATPLHAVRSSSRKCSSPARKSSSRLPRSRSAKKAHALPATSLCPAASWSTCPRFITPAYPAKYFPRKIVRAFAAWS